jgi:thiol-disulfide isomerase/thioredoxin
MRTLFAAMLAVGLSTSVHAQKDDPKKEDPKKAEKLTVGDPAPPLKATKWLQGTEVTEFKKDHVYVVEFWATWCGPCIVMMPHMGELQSQYKGSVTFIGYSAKDPNNSAEKVAALVAKRGPKLGYTFAYADERDTYDAWMKAAGQNGIPCCFVVGKDGKIAYIGHPMYLDVILPKVVAGKWTAEDAEGIKKVEADVMDVFKSLGGDADAGLKALSDFEAKYPPLAHIPYFVGPKIGLLLKAEKFAEATKMAEEVIAKASKQENASMLSQVSGALRSPAAKEKKELLALSVKAAEAGVKLAGDKDPVPLYYLAEAHFAAGDKAKAQELAKKAIEAADNAQMKATLERLTKKYGEEKKDEKKD